MSFVIHISLPTVLPEQPHASPITHENNKLSYLMDRARLLVNHHGEIFSTSNTFLKQHNESLSSADSMRVHFSLPRRTTDPLKKQDE